MITLKEHLQKSFKEYMVMGEDPCDFYDDLLFSIRYEGLPQLPTERYNFETKSYYIDTNCLEPLDFENRMIFQLCEDGFTISAGGDWQEPKTFRVTFKEGLFYCSDIRDGYTAEGPEADWYAFAEFYELEIDNELTVTHTTDPFGRIPKED